jgi:hypothetical protein
VGSDLGCHKLAADVGPPFYLLPSNVAFNTSGFLVFDWDTPERHLVEFSRDLEKKNVPSSQVGVQFVQIGDDPTATRTLRYLDEDLPRKYRVRDIVDTVRYRGSKMSSDNFRKTLLGGVLPALDEVDGRRGG